MSLEPKAVPDRIPSKEPVANELGSLGVCLVDGDAEQQGRGRKVRRSAFIISVLLQGAALTLLLLFPLFGRTEHIVIKAFVPMPPYGHPSNPQRGNTRPANGRPAIGARTFTFHPPTPGSRAHRVDTDLPPGPSDDPLPGASSPGGPGCNWCVDIGERSKSPLPPPQQENTVRRRPQILKEPTIDPAMLIHRVEPVYPPLALQIHREGRVELRAIIATDGSIRSLQIISGDSLFLRSATEAVKQWRYKPTYLNGEPVEIDTYITVVYTLQH